MAIVDHPQQPDNAMQLGTEQRLPPTMTAISQDRAGGPDVLKVVESDRPVPGATEILVRVHAAGVNPHDCKTRARGYSSYNDDALPFVLGFDVSGVVAAVGSGVTVFQPGDEVFGAPRFPQHAGAYAEYVTGPARHFAPKPAGLEHVQAAGLPLAGLTAWQALVDTAHVRPGQRVLIHAAAGGVGHLAVQIAKAHGAYVIGTATTSKHELLQRLGADELVDYTQQDFATALGDIDIVLDTLGGDVTHQSLATMRPGGTLVTILPPGPPRNTDDASGLPSNTDVTIRWLLYEPDGAALRELAALVDTARLQVLVDSVYPLTKAGDAHRQAETGRATGKIVLAVASEHAAPTAATVNARHDGRPRPTQQSAADPLTAAHARAILAAAEQAWHDRDLDALVAAVHPDVRIRFNNQPEIRGRDDARAWLGRRFETQHDYRLQKTLRGLDGALIISSWTGGWRDSQTGERLRGRGIELLTVERGLIREWDAVLHSWTDHEQ